MSVVGILKEGVDIIKTNLPPFLASSGFHYVLSGHNTVTSQTREN
jgi:hypothetical protein